MSHTFYVFKSTKHHDSTISLTPNKRIAELIEIGISKSRRYEETSKLMHAFHNSEKSPRQQKVDQILGNSAEKDELYDILCNVPNPIINGVLYERSINSTKRYARYNELLLKTACRVELGALANKQYMKALIAPSYDGSINGKLLVSILYDKVTNKGSYIGVVYDILTKRLTEEPVLDLFNKFNHLHSMPFDIADILKVRRISNYVYSNR